MIRILYDYQGFLQRIGGVSRQHVEILRGLSSQTKGILPTLLTDNIYLDEIGYSHKYPLPNWKSKFKDNVYKQINQWRSIIELERVKYDLFHVTGLNPYFISHVKKPVLSTQHDLSFEKHPDMFGNSTLVSAKRKKVLSISNHVNCVSIQTKNDLIDLYNYPEEKIDVVYPGSNGKVIICNDSPLFSFPYILYVGGRNGYKNFMMFAKSFALLPKDYHLICTGVPFNKNEIELFTKLNINERVHQKFVTDVEMENLLCYANLFVYPSFSEGFGLPLLDSFRASCPCVASDIMCFHEVADDAILYFNPFDIDDMSDKMKRVLDDSDLQRKMIAKGLERVPLFTWKKCAEETEKVYYKIL